MATMITEVYDALRDAQGVSEEKARRAAEAVAAFESRFVSLERQIDQLDAKVDLRFADMDAKMDRRFAETDAKMERRFAETDAKIDRLDAKIDRRYADLDAKVDRRYADLDAKIDLRVEELRGSLRMMQWMLGTMIAGLAALLIKSFG